MRNIIHFSCYNPFGCGCIVTAVDDTKENIKSQGQGNAIADKNRLNRSVMSKNSKNPFGESKDLMSDTSMAKY